MTSSTSAPRRRYAVVLLTALWVVACLASLWWLFTIGMEGWADHHSNGGGRSAEIGRRSAQALLLLVAVAAGGSAVIALVAFGCRYRRTGLVFLVLAVVIAAALTPALVDAARRLRPPDSPVPVPTTCQEHSGGDTRCPGG